MECKLKSVPMLVYNRDEAEALIAHQRTIEAILAGSSEESHMAMIHELRRFYKDDPAALVDICLFEINYHPNAALQWYTRDTFLFRFINEVLRLSDVRLMFKMGRFLCDLYFQLDQQYRAAREGQGPQHRDMFYRGQAVSREDFDKFRRNIGELITIKTFFSTTTSLEAALLFTDAYRDDNNEAIATIFCIGVNSDCQSPRPHANISHFSVYPDEEEVLFAMGSLFRIRSIDRLEPERKMPVIVLELTEPTYIDEHPLV